MLLKKIELCNGLSSGTEKKELPDLFIAELSGSVLDMDPFLIIFIYSDPFYETMDCVTTAAAVTWR